METLLHINSIGVVGVRGLLKGLKHDARELGCGSVWSEVRTETCPLHVVITDPSTLVLDRLKGERVPHVITLDDDDETVALVTTNWTEPDCEAH